MDSDILSEYLKAGRQRVDARDHGPVSATTIIKRKKAPRNLLRDSDNGNNYDCEPCKRNIDKDNNCSSNNDEDEDELYDNNDYHHDKFLIEESTESCISVKKQNNCNAKSLSTSSALSSRRILAPLSHRSSSHSPHLSSSHSHSDPLESLPVCSKCGQETDVRSVEIFSDTLFILCL